MPLFQTIGTIGQEHGKIYLRSAHQTYTLKSMLPGSNWADNYLQQQCVVTGVIDNSHPQELILLISAIRPCLKRQIACEEAQQIIKHK